MKRFWIKPGILALVVMMMAMSFASCDTGGGGGGGGIIRHSTEVVVIGAGGAGFAAALEALEGGRDVILIEKNAFTGGKTATAGSAANAANQAMLDALDLTLTDGEIDFIERMLDPLTFAGIYSGDRDIVEGWQTALQIKWNAHTGNSLFDSPYLHSLQTFYGGDSIARASLVDLVGQRGLEALMWLEGLSNARRPGPLWETRLTAAIGATWRRSHAPIPGRWGPAGAAFFMPMEATFEHEGGTVLMGYRANRIIMENGRAVGVAGTTDTGDMFEIRASRGVILTTGGFGANRPMLIQHNRFWPNNFEGIGTTNLPTATGDGHVMASAIGASLIDMEWIQLVSGLGSVMEGGAIQSMMMINVEGERFINEDGRRDNLCYAIVTQPGMRVWGIQDMHTYNLGDGYHFSGATFAQWEAASALHLITESDEFEPALLEVAQHMLQHWPDGAGTPPTEAVLHETLIDEVNLFNAIARGEEDCPWGRAVFANEINAPPFIVNWATASIHHTMGGVEITPSAQVTHVSGGVIPGLYAAGEVVGGIHGANRLGANAITEILVFGRIAGQTVAQDEAE